MAALATPDDLAAGWRVLTSDEEDVAAVLLDRASALVRLAVADVDARVTASSDYGVLVVAVVTSMVQRAMLNPTGVTSVSKSVDDFTTTERYDAAVPGLYLSDLDMLQLLQEPGTTGRRVRSVSLGY